MGKVPIVWPAETTAQKRRVWPSRDGIRTTCGSRAQKEQGVKDPRSGEDDSIELGVADAASATGGKSNGEILAAALEGCNSLIDEMMDDGVQFALWSPHDGWPERCRQVIDAETGEQVNNGTGFVNYFEERAGNAGARILTNTRARKVVVGDDGRVVDEIQTLRHDSGRSGQNLDFATPS